MSAFHRCLSLPLIFLATVPIADQSGAIEIELVFRNEMGGPNVPPINSQDPTGTNLIRLFEYAETFYEDVFEDGGHTLTINYWWEDLDSLGTSRLGQHDLIGQTNAPVPPFPVNYCSTLVSPDPLCREDVANIRIDNDRSWFLDATPEDDSEFNMQQTLWRDLPTGFSAWQPRGPIQ